MRVSGTHLGLEDGRSGQERQPASLGLSTLLGLHRLPEAVALAIHLENLRSGGSERSSSAAVIRSPWKIWPHSLNGRLLVTRMLPRS